MATNSHMPDDSQTKTFKTFPGFSKLTLSDRDRYDELIKAYPPLADISFSGLMVWWNTLNACAISLLNDNLVISYWFPGNDLVSGLCLVGTNRVDESICLLFDHLRSQGSVVELVHVPEFVISQLQYPEMYVCTEERGFDEYVFDIAKFYPLNQTLSYRRHRIRSFLARNDEEHIQLYPIDLSEEKNINLLLEHEWPQKGINRMTSIFDESWEYTLRHAPELGLDNLCLFMDGKLRAYCIFHRPADKRYVIFKHAKIDYDVPRLFDYFAYALARHFNEQGIAYVNLDSDLGLQSLRMIFLALGPSNYFRKYTVRPRKTKE
jgi:hypothetical protein